MSVSVASTPWTSRNRLATTSARSSLFCTRTLATRSTRPATENTAVTSGMAASCSPTVSICPRATLMWTTALTMRAAYSVRDHRRDLDLHQGAGLEQAHLEQAHRRVGGAHQ